MTEHNSLAAALSAFQAELPAVKKGATGQVPGKGKYKYADLSDLSAAVLPLLGKHGLSWMTMPTVNENGAFVLRYELLHTSGEARTGDFPLHGNDNWSIGSSLTYGRRFCLSAVTGVAADEDDDGAAAQGTPPAQRQKPPGPTADQLRDKIRNIAKANGIDYAAYAEQYKAGAKTDLNTETEPAKLQKFIDAVNDGRVQVAPEPSP